MITTQPDSKIPSEASFSFAGVCSEHTDFVREALSVLLPVQAHGVEYFYILLTRCL